MLKYNRYIPIRKWVYSKEYTGLRITNLEKSENIAEKNV
jgi:hypothetical protein